jgi:hypothetical protein
LTTSIAYKKSEPAMEFIIIFSVIGGIIFIIWKVRANSRAAKAAALNRAWREVLSDPNYLQRRDHEERKREDRERRMAKGL